MSSYRNIPVSKLRRILTKEKRLVFVTTVDFNHGSLWDSLVAHGVCTRIQMENLRANHKSSNAQASAFLSHLERRSDRDYYKFFDALIAVDMYDTVKKLTGIDMGPSESSESVEAAYNYPTPSINRPYPDQRVISTAPQQHPPDPARGPFLPRQPEPTTTLPEPHICSAIGPNIHVPGGVSNEDISVEENELLSGPLDSQTEHTPIQESMNNNSNNSEIEGLERGLSEIVLSDAFGLQPVNVNKTTHEFYEDKHEKMLLLDETEEYYLMTMRERGHVLIINNKHFEGRGPESTRTGTDVDSDKLEQLWTQLHFRTITYSNLTSQQILLAVQQFANSQQENGQACIMYILTHGKAGQVIGSDNKEVFIDEIFSFFDNEKCVAMRGKPKLFFFQACQGDKFDHGIVFSDSMGTAPKKDIVQSDVDPYGTTRKPKMTDFLVGYPTLEGYRSFRSGETGSWYIQAMVKIFAKYAARCDIVKLLTMVNKVVSRQVGTTRMPSGLEVNATQMPNYNSALTKDLFFFPGVVDT